MKGAVITTGAIFTGLISFFVAWNAWLSSSTIKLSNEAAAAIQWQEDYGKKIDWLVQRNGANPKAIDMYYQPQTLTENQ